MFSFLGSYQYLSTILIVSIPDFKLPAINLHEILALFINNNLLNQGFGLLFIKISSWHGFR